MNALAGGATGAVVAAVAGLPTELLGAGVGYAISGGWSRFKDRLQRAEPKLNHDFQRALRKAYLLATEEMVTQAILLARRETLVTDDRSLLESALAAVREELRTIAQ
ncbi:MAG: hypothetical protein FJW30_19335 [Acidobacteria bacterium]|nr:hypothetical protein [Acidobacteriota bacterium]